MFNVATLEGILSDMDISPLVNELMVQELLSLRESLEDDLECAKIGDVRGVYSFHPDRERKELKKSIKAVKRVLSLYSTS